MSWELTWNLHLAILLDSSEGTDQISTDLSWMEMSKLIPTLFLGFDLELADPSAEWKETCWYEDFYSLASQYKKANVSLEAEWTTCDIVAKGKSLKKENGGRFIPLNLDASVHYQRAGNIHHCPSVLK